MPFVKSAVSDLVSAVCGKVSEPVSGNVVGGTGSVLVAEGGIEPP